MIRGNFLKQPYAVYRLLDLVENERVITMTMAHKV